uniref:Mitochondrial import receptor subunit TOM7 homolog n=1 Tax=Hydra vulgaris TaxID=6087 RepID=T2M484_HYDVU
MVKFSPSTKKSIQSIFKITKTTFHWGFIPFVIYLGLKKGADPGMPEPTLLSLLWA